MKKIIRIWMMFVCLTVSSCSVKKSMSDDHAVGETPVAESETADRDRFSQNFKLIEDFRVNKNSFDSTWVGVYEFSTDGGDLVVFQSDEKDYFVVDIWLYGETGQIHTSYWTDKKRNFKLVKHTDIRFDKPYYDGDYTTEEVTEYFSYSDNSFKRYNSDRQEFSDDEDNEKESFVRELFADVIAGQSIVPSVDR